MPIQEYVEPPADTPCRYIELPNKINWTSVIVQAIAQALILGGLAVGYIVTNERWKGGVDENLKNLTSINLAQTAINLRLASAIDKLNENVQILGRNQERVITLLETHMSQTGQAARMDQFRR
jgi:hypothetical protein